MNSGWLEALLSLVFPPRCPACRGKVARHGAWCSVCLAKFLAPRRIDPAGHKLKWIDGCYVLCDYEAGLKRLIRDMKFRKVSRYRSQFKWLIEAGLAGQNLPDGAWVVPVPLSPRRERERGFNQTELIFREWATASGRLWLDGLQRIKETLPQWELELAARRPNIQGAFRVSRQDLVKGKAILLVDDIFTTGLTMDECARELKKAGARQVYCLALASGAK